MSTNANEDGDCVEDWAELNVVTAYTDCGLEEGDTGVDTLMGGAETA